MRRPCADREEKRVTHGNDDRGRREEQLDPDDPNQRGSQRYVMHYQESACIFRSKAAGDSWGSGHRFAASRPPWTTPRGAVFVKAVVRRVHAASLILRASVARPRVQRRHQRRRPVARLCADHRSGLAARPLPRGRHAGRARSDPGLHAACRARRSGCRCAGARRVPGGEAFHPVAAAASSMPPADLLAGGTPCGRTGRPGRGAGMRLVRALPRTEIHPRVAPAALGQEPAKTAQGLSPDNSNTL